MKYLFVSATLRDAGGFAMIRGAMNGLKTLDDNAEFRCLLRKEHDKKGICLTYIFPRGNQEAFKWADIVLDVGGLCTRTPIKYVWLKLRRKFNKPYVWMSQSFLEIDTSLLKDTFIVARGKTAAQKVRSCGFKATLAADLSFLVKPKKWKGKNYQRVFVTHIAKRFRPMFRICRRKTDVQIFWKPSREPKLPIDHFYGTVEEKFGLIASAKEVHTARYQAGCAAILAGKKPRLYLTGKGGYDRKYADLKDFYGMPRQKLIASAMLSCKVAYEAVQKWS